MQQLKREASRAPPPKGRRNLNSVDFLGALSHDFCPIAGGEKAKQPTDYSYAVWNGAVPRLFRLLLLCIIPPTALSSVICSHQLLHNYCGDLSDMQRALLAPREDGGRQGERGRQGGGGGGRERQGGREGAV